MLKKIKNFFLTFKKLKTSCALLFYRLKYFNGGSDLEYTFELRNGIRVNATKKKGDLGHLHGIFIEEEYSFTRDPAASLNIVDIGANAGYFSLYASQKFPNSKIYAFEPFPETYACLVENLKLNDFKNIKAFQYAVSDKSGLMDFYSVEWAGMNTLIKDKFDEGHYQTSKVSCISFDKIFSMAGVDKFDFAKIDCEGSEYPMLLNSPDETIRKVKEYVIEVHFDKNYSYKDMIERFEKLGYKTDYKNYLLRAVSQK
jgi:FkbM family methyltransferase